MAGTNEKNEDDPRAGLELLGGGYVHGERKRTSVEQGTRKGMEAGLVLNTLSSWNENIKAISHGARIDFLFLNVCREWNTAEQNGITEGRRGKEKEAEVGREVGQSALKKPRDEQLPKKVD